MVQVRTRAWALGRTLLGHPELLRGQPGNGLWIFPICVHAFLRSSPVDPRRYEPEGCPFDKGELPEFKAASCPAGTSIGSGLAPAAGSIAGKFLGPDFVFVSPGCHQHLAHG